MKKQTIFSKNEKQFFLSAVFTLHSSGLPKLGHLHYMATNLGPNEALTIPNFTSEISSSWQTRNLAQFPV